MAMCKSSRKREENGKDIKCLQLMDESWLTKRLLDLMNRTQYQITQVNGQRTYGPPPYWNGDPPSKECEVFVGRIPRDCFEDEIIPVLEKAGIIYEFRLMMDFGGTNRGYGFAMYRKQSEAQNAIRLLNHHQIRPGQYLGIVKSVNNCCLFIGGLDLDVTVEELMKRLTELTSGATNAIFHYYKGKNFTVQKKFALVSYETHRAAAMARRVLVPLNDWFRGKKTSVDWANPFSKDTLEKHKYPVRGNSAFPRAVKYEETRNNRIVALPTVQSNRSRRTLAPEYNKGKFHAENLVGSNQNSQIPVTSAEFFTETHTKFLARNSVTGIDIPSVSKCFEPQSVVIIPQNIIPAANLALQQFMLSAYEASLLNKPVTFLHLVQKPLVREDIDFDAPY